MKNLRGALIAFGTRGGRATRISRGSALARTGTLPRRAATGRRLVGAVLAAALLVPLEAHAADAQSLQVYTAWAWGDNSRGQLGDGTTRSRPGPGAVPGMGRMGAVAAGDHHSLAVRSTDGTVWAWGSNSVGQLGDGTTENRSAPVMVPAADGTLRLFGMVAVAAGDAHSLALRQDGRVFAWGSNEFGQLGDGPQPHRRPVLVRGLEGATAVAAGARHSLALRNGTVLAWGDNADGQLGDGTIVNRDRPVAVSGLGEVIAVAAGDAHSLALRQDGRVFTWGSNEFGQLGDGTTDSRPQPEAVPQLSGVVAIAAGGSHSLAVRSDGAVWAWGDNRHGQLGDGTTVNRTGPEEVWDSSEVVAIAAGRHHSVAVLGDGAALAWGGNTHGQLGDGTTENRSAPVEVPASSGVTAIAAGGAHSLALRLGPPIRPGAPNRVRATPGDASVEVSWTTPPDGGSPISGYTVTVPGGAPKTVDGDVTSTEITGLTNGESYIFTVHATNEAGDGLSSSSDPVIPVPATAPGAPDWARAGAGDGSAFVWWRTPDNNGAPITAYIVTVLPDERGVEVPGTATSTTISGLTNGTSYRFTVAAVNRIGVGPPSPLSNPITPTPRPVTGLSGTVDFDSPLAAAPKPRVKLVWTNQGTPEAIEVSWSDGTTEEAITLAPAPSAYTVTGLDHGKAYTFRVRAVAGGVDSTPASVSTSGSAMTSAVKPAVVTSGASTKVSGRLTRAGTTTGLGDQPVQLQIRTQNASRVWSVWSNVGSPVRTTSTGTYAIAHRTPRSAQYRVLFTGVGSRLGSVSPMRAVNVAPRVTAALSTASMRLDSTTRLSGKVSPNLAGKTVHLQKRVGDRWVDVRGMSQRLTSTSTYRFSIKPGSRGTHTYRVRVPAYAPYVKGFSPRRTLTVS
jgi:alpha-tubulin suppressor-like RCC1 family protein